MLDIECVCVFALAVVERVLARDLAVVECSISRELVFALAR